MLRLLSEWVIEMPRAVTGVISSSSSVSVGVLVRLKQAVKNSSQVVNAVPALSGLLLGFCSEYMTDSDDSASWLSSTGNFPDMENTVWTRETIMNMVQSMGVGKYLNMIDGWRKRPFLLPYCKGEERSSMERRMWSTWYGHNVTLVCRRVVMALVVSREDGEYDNSYVKGVSGDADNGKSSSSLWSLRRMVFSQSQDMENLQARLDEALCQGSSQSI